MAVIIHENKPLDTHSKQPASATTLVQFISQRGLAAHSSDRHDRSHANKMSNKSKAECPPNEMTCCQSRKLIRHGSE